MIVQHRGLQEIDLSEKNYRVIVHDAPALTPLPFPFRPTFYFPRAALTDASPGALGRIFAEVSTSKWKPLTLRLIFISKFLLICSLLHIVQLFNLTHLPLHLTIICQNNTALAHAAPSWAVSFTFLLKSTRYSSSFFFPPASHPKTPLTEIPHIRKDLVPSCTILEVIQVGLSALLDGGQYPISVQQYKSSP